MYFFIVKRANLLTKVTTYRRTVLFYKFNTATLYKTMTNSTRYNCMKNIRYKV